MSRRALFTDLIAEVDLQGAHGFKHRAHAVDEVVCDGWPVALELGLCEPVAVDDFHLLDQRALARLAGACKVGQVEGEEV